MRMTVLFLLCLLSGCHDSDGEAMHAFRGGDSRMSSEASPVRTKFTPYKFRIDGSNGMKMQFDITASLPEMVIHIPLPKALEEEWNVVGAEILDHPDVLPAMIGGGGDSFDSMEVREMTPGATYTFVVRLHGKQPVPEWRVKPLVKALNEGRI